MPMKSTPASSIGKSLSSAAVRISRADTRVVEQLLDHDEPADQVAGLGGDDGDRREQRVAQHVPPDHYPAGQPFEGGCAHVIGVERLDRARPGHAGDVAEEDEHERDGGKDQVLQLG